jgi:hypothetical protein
LQGDRLTTAFRNQWDVELFSYAHCALHHFGEDMSRSKILAVLLTGSLGFAGVVIPAPSFAQYSSQAENGTGGGAGGDGGSGSLTENQGSFQRQDRRYMDDGADMRTMRVAPSNRLYDEEQTVYGSDDARTIRVR